MGSCLTDFTKNSSLAGHSVEVTQLTLVDMETSDFVMMPRRLYHHMGLIRKAEKDTAFRGSREAGGGGGVEFLGPTEQCGVCVRHRPGPVNQNVYVCVFLWKSHHGSTNTDEGSTPAAKQRPL